MKMAVSRLRWELMPAITMATASSTMFITTFVDDSSTLYHNGRGKTIFR